jgi:FMN reductase
MMQVLTLAGSPSRQSRSAGLLKHAGHWLETHGVAVSRWQVRDFPAEDLLYGNFASPAVLGFIEDLAKADGLLVATPIYKASFSGALKTLLDVLPERALAGKVVLPLATGGSPAHLLALDYALKPVLGALKAQELLQGVYADDSLITWEEQRAVLAPPLRARLDSALDQFLTSLARRPRPLHPGQLGERLAIAQWGI